MSKVLLVFVYLLIGAPAFAELSEISAHRIKQGIAQCNEVDNKLIYNKYWRDSVESEQLKAVCMAEQFADQVATDGDPWLRDAATSLVTHCRAQSQKQESYFLCLKMSLDEIIHELAYPCVELEVEKLWSEEKCRRLVSYIFMKKFEMILEDYQPVVDAISPTIDTTQPQLSLTNLWRIEDAIRWCNESDNALIYKEYWAKTVKPEDIHTVCIAEQFADQVAADGDA